MRIAFILFLSLALNGFAESSLPAGNIPKWNGVAWNGVAWNGLTWNGINQNGVNWNGYNWNGPSWNGYNWNAQNTNPVPSPSPSPSPSPLSPTTTQQLEDCMPMANQLCYEANFASSCLEKDENYRQSIQCTLPGTVPVYNGSEQFDYETGNCEGTTVEIFCD